MRRTLVSMYALVGLTSLLIVSASPARARRAGVADFSNCTVPTSVTLVGVSGGAPDPAGVCSVTIRDVASYPVAGAHVEFDLSRCTDLRIAATQPYPGLTVDCAAKRVGAYTDASGVAHLSIVGGALNPGGAPGARFLSMRIYSDGELLTPLGITASALDQDGFDGLHANDMAAWLADLFAGRAVERSDYDGNGALGASDLSIWVARFLAANSTQGAASLPGGLCP